LAERVQRSQGYALSKTKLLGEGFAAFQIVVEPYDSRSAVPLLLSSLGR
jgi:hypothetical protein